MQILKIYYISFVYATYINTLQTTSKVKNLFLQ